MEFIVLLTFSRLNFTKRLNIVIEKIGKTLLLFDKESTQEIHKREIGICLIKVAFGVNQDKLCIFI
jgi:hypothetical protein